MSQNPPTSTIETFRRQRQRMKKLLAAFLLSIALGIGMPVALASLPALQNNPAWKGIGVMWLSGAGILCLLILVAAFLTQRCPACGKPIGEEFWLVRYCSQCGAKLTDD